MSIELQQKVLDECGDRGANCVWQLALPLVSTSGTWNFTFGGQTTDDLARYISKAELQSALENLSTIGEGNVEVIGIKGGPFRIELKGELGTQALPEEVYPLTANGDNLEPQAVLTPVQEREGRSVVCADKIAQFDETYSTVANEELRKLYMKRDVLYILIGEAQKGVDAAQGDRREDLSQQFEHLMAMLKEAKAEILRITNAGLTNSGAAGSVPASTPFAGKIAKKTPNGKAFGVLSYNPCNGRWR